MTKIETIRKLEAKYNCMITVDPSYSYETNKRGEIYTIFSADGHRWACVDNYRMLLAELKESATDLRRLIK